MMCCRDALRATRAAQPAAGGGGDAAAMLGKPGEALSFESLARSKGAQVPLALDMWQATLMRVSRSLPLRF